MKRICLSAAASIGAFALCWYGGMDFDQRGFTQAFVSLYCIGAGFAVYFIPGWDD